MQNVNLVSNIIKIKAHIRIDIRPYHIFVCFKRGRNAKENKPAHSTGAPVNRPMSGLVTARILLPSLNCFQC